MEREYTYNGITIHYDLNEENGNCQIKDSYLISSRNFMEHFVSLILMDHEVFGCRSEESYVREWRAHNLLYNLGFQRARTKDCDLNCVQLKIFKVGYAILSAFYKGTK